MDRKLAQDLVAGDRVMVTVGHEQLPATVMAVVESTQVIRKKVLMVTLRNKDGRDAHRQFYPNATFRMVEGD